MDTVRIGGGAGFLGDRVDSAVDLVKRGRLDAVVIDALAERTLALLHMQNRLGGPGYSLSLEGWMNALLPVCAETRTCLVTNAGGVSPIDAALMTRSVARGAGLRNMRIAAVTGDDVSAIVAQMDPVLLETGEPVSAFGKSPIGANAYIGSEAIAEAYSEGADVIIAGRATDSALALGPAMASFGWQPTDQNAMACGAVVGHLIECGPQLTGGYFADPMLKNVPDLHRVGFPIAEIRSDLSIELSKPDHTGGRIDRHTVTEQLLYEMKDPSCYITPDVTLDITNVELDEIERNRVRLSGALGRPRPNDLKVLVSLSNGFVAEAEISYGGISAKPKAMLAQEIIRKRTAKIPSLARARIHTDLIGINSLWRERPLDIGVISEVRLRTCGRFESKKSGELLIREVEALYTSGPSGGAGVRYSLEPSVRTLTTFLPRSSVPVSWDMASESN